MLHSGDEFVLCLRGQLEYLVEGKHFVLEPGDSLLFSAHLRHRWRNPGNVVTNALILLSNFEEHEQPVEYHQAAGNDSEESLDIEDTETSEV